MGVLNTRTLISINCTTYAYELVIARLPTRNLLPLLDRVQREPVRVLLHEEAGVRRQLHADDCHLQRIHHRDAPHPEAARDHQKYRMVQRSRSSV